MLLFVGVVVGIDVIVVIFVVVVVVCDECLL